MLFDQMVHASFTHGMAGVNAILEEYYKSIIAVTLSPSKSGGTTFNEKVTCIMDHLPLVYDEYEYSPSYVNMETHEVTCILRKKRS